MTGKEVVLWTPPPDPPQEKPTAYAVIEWDTDTWPGYTRVRCHGFAVVSHGD